MRALAFFVVAGLQVPTPLAACIVTVRHIFPVAVSLDAMKFGIRTPSLRKRIAARTSVRRYIRHSLGFKAPRGWGWLTNPKRAAYNRVYNRTTVGCVVVLPVVLGTVAMVALLLG